MDFPLTRRNPLRETEGGLSNLNHAVDVRRFHDPQHLQARKRIAAFLPRGELRPMIGSRHSSVSLKPFAGWL